MWAEAEAEPDLPYTREYERPLGHLTFVLSDSHGNSAHVACDVQHPGDNSAITWTSNPHSAAELSVNISLATALECEIDRETLQNLWQLVAYYYESPAILERGLQRRNTSRATYQYAQVANENSPYFTELKGYLVAEPSWLLQPKVTLRLNRQQTTTKKLAMDFTTVIVENIISHRGHEENNDLTSSWAMIQRGTAGRVQSALEGSKVHLECSVVTSHQQVKVEWMLPDLSIVEGVTEKVEILETGELVIANASQSDSGLYHCMVRTKAGVDLMSLRLTIKERALSPSAFNGQKITVEKGSSVYLPCEVTSVHPSETVWYLPKKQTLLPTQQSRRAEVMENGTLIVRRLTEEDAGEYSCLASNLYGVDMLSHMVEVTGSKVSDKSKVQTEQEISPIHEDDWEGSGGDYQEIIHPFATLFPRLRTGQRNLDGFSKRIRMKDSKRKPKRPEKKLEQNQWVKILAKTSPHVSMTTGPGTSSPPTTTTMPSTTTTNVLNATITYFRIETPGFPNTTVKTQIHLTEKEQNTNKEAETLETPPTVLLPPPTKRTETTLHHSGGLREKSDATTAAPPVEYPRQFEKMHTKPFKESQRNYVPGRSNRRRPPFRRRKLPMRRVHPHLKPINHLLNNILTTVTPPTTTTTTPTNSTMTTTTQPAPNADYKKEKKESQYYEGFDYKEVEPNTEDIDSSHFLDSFTTFPPTPENDPFIIINSTSQRHNLSIPVMEIDITTDSVKGKIVHNEKDSKNQLVLVGQTMERERHTENFRQDWVTQTTSTQHSILLSQNISKSNNDNLIKQYSLNNEGNPSSKVITSQSGRSRTREEIIQKENKEEDKTRRNPDIHSFPIEEPVHPWLHQHNQGSGQTTSSQMSETHPDRKPGRHGENNLVWPFLLPHIPPTTPQLPPSKNHHHHYPFNLPWPDQRSFPHPRQGKITYCVNDDICFV